MKYSTTSFQLRVSSLPPPAAAPHPACCRRQNPASERHDRHRRRCHRPGVVVQKRGKSRGGGSGEERNRKTELLTHLKDQILKARKIRTTKRKMPNNTATTTPTTIDLLEIVVDLFARRSRRITTPTATSCCKRHFVFDGELKLFGFGGELLLTSKLLALLCQETIRKKRSGKRELRSGRRVACHVQPLCPSLSSLGECQG